jgi:anaerobic dimethyl sulfoxide reductase subunit B (iron-sulfur subunit)
VSERDCLGCRYCEWACAYGAPQFSVATGLMSKCDLCADERGAGRAPACVAACPLRALDAGPIDELRERYGTLASLAPLPDAAATGPSVVLVAPRRPGVPGDTAVRIVNAEEILR